MKLASWGDYEHDVLEIKELSEVHRRFFLEQEKNDWDEACLACGYRKVVSKKTLGQIIEIEEKRKSYINQ